MRLCPMPAQMRPAPGTVWSAVIAGGGDACCRSLCGGCSTHPLLCHCRCSWWTAKGEGWENGGLFWHPSTESDLTTLASYYDCPSLSLRAAVHPLFRSSIPGFKVGVGCTLQEVLGQAGRAGAPDSCRRPAAAGVLAWAELNWCGGLASAGCLPNTLTLLCRLANYFYFDSIHPSGGGSRGVLGAGWWGVKR